jgi:hypothetical protein
MRGTTSKSGVAYKRDVSGALHSAHGPSNPPSPPNAAGLNGKVSFVWTESSPFTRYDIEYVIGSDTDTPERHKERDVATPFEVPVPNGTTVSARLFGWTDEFEYHEPSPWREGTAAAAPRKRKKTDKGE